MSRSSQGFTREAELLGDFIYNPYTYMNVLQGSELTQLWELAKSSMGTYLFSRVAVKET